MLTIALSLLSYAPAPQTNCTPSTTNGCLNGKPYDFSTQFPCGPHDIYNYADASCCEQGRPFGTQDQYCCTGSGQTGVHSYSDGKCDLATPDACACYDAVKEPMSAKIDYDNDDLVDTTNPPSLGYQCESMEGTSIGCLNGYKFDFSEYTTCGSYLMKYGNYGCCPSSAGFLPYLIGTMYCCKIEGAPPGQDYQLGVTPCKCHRYGCDGWPLGP